MTYIKPGAAADIEQPKKCVANVFFKVKDGSITSVVPIPGYGRHAAHNR